MSPHEARALGQGSPSQSVLSHVPGTMLISLSCNPWVVTVIILMLHMEKLRLREVKCALLEVTELQVEGELDPGL